MPYTVSIRPSDLYCISLLNESGCVMSGDAKLVKCWLSKLSALFSFFLPKDDDDDPTTTPIDTNNTEIGSILANIEETSNFSHFLSVGDAFDSTGHSSGLESRMYRCNVPSPIS